MPQGPELQVVFHARYRRYKETPGRGRHEDHLISLLVHGRGRYTYGNLEVDIDSPRISFLPAGCDDVNELRGPVEAWWAGFRWPGFETGLCGKGLVQASWNGRQVQTPVFKLLDARGVARFVERYRTLRAARERQDLAGAFQAQAGLYELFQAFLELPYDPAALNEHRALSRFRDLLEQQACRPVGIEALAARAGGSADHLRDLFRARYGLRPVEFRTQLRLEKAKQLLVESTLNIKEVAHETGYPDPLYFSRVFHRRFGYTPSEMVRRYRLSRR
ncbi:MAG: AraC family transcriptional regulator [Planctomycetota bacterium]|nr:AraC family transcriptional regulator [Planctomycetota bacterium]